MVAGSAAAVPASAMRTGSEPSEKRSVEYCRVAELQCCRIGVL